MRLSCLFLAAWLGLACPALAQEPARDTARDIPPAVLNLLFTAQEWLAKGNLQAARDACLDALAKDPGDAFAALKLAQVEGAQGKHGEALARIEAVLGRDPDNLLALVWKGHLLLGTGRPDQARECYQRLLSLSPGHAWALAGMGAALAASGQDKEAVEHLAQAQAAAGEDAVLHHALGEVFAILGLPVNARLELERSLEINPRNASALILAGDVYQRLGLSHLALNTWRQALALAPGDLNALHHLLAVLAEQALQAQSEGRAEEAAHIWRTLLGYDPANARALLQLKEAGLQAAPAQPDVRP